MPGKRKHSGRPKRKKRRRRTVQVSIHWRMHGGRRRGAGRKPRGKRGGVPHRSRGEVLPTTPVHVGLKVAAEIGNLRHPTLFGPLRAAIYEGADSFGMRVIHYSVVKDHLHFIVEAESSAALSRGMQGLTIRMAKRINKVLGRRGKVFIDRYWSHVLRSPSETRAALNYVLKNVSYCVTSLCVGNLETQLRGRWCVPAILSTRTAFFEVGKHFWAREIGLSEDARACGQGVQRFNDALLYGTLDG